MAVLEKRIKDCKSTSPFLSFARNVTSQGGEDGILSEIFRCVGCSSSTGRGFCVDIGAWDGEHWSNTYRLINEDRWGGLLVEANPERSKAMQRLYHDRKDVFCCDRLVELSGSNSLGEILSSYGVDKNFDFLSIDIDGADFHVWRSLGNKYTPRVVCVEFNPSIPNHVYFVQEENIQIQQGSSLLALVELGKQLGYQLVCTTTFNAIFVRRDLFASLPQTSSDYSLDSLHSAAMVTDMFQTYDGQLRLAGPQKLLWHRKAINSQKIQPLSRKQQLYPFAPPSTVHMSVLEKNIDSIVKSLSELCSHHDKNNDIKGLLVILRNAMEELSSSSSALCSEINNCQCQSFSFDYEALLLSVSLCTYGISMVIDFGKIPEDLLHSFSKIAFNHSINVSEIFFDRGDKESANDPSLAQNLFKKSLSIIVMTMLLDKEGHHPYREHMVKVTSRLTNISSPGDQDSFYDSLFWLYFSRLVSPDDSNTNREECSQHLIKKWRSKICKRLSSIGISKDTISRHFSNTTSSFATNLQNVQPLSNEVGLPNDDCFTFESRAYIRKIRRMLLDEATEEQRCSALHRENKILRISTLLLASITVASLLAPRWMKLIG